MRNLLQLADNETLQPEWQKPEMAACGLGYKDGSPNWRDRISPTLAPAARLRNTNAPDLQPDM